MEYTFKTLDELDITEDLASVYSALLKQLFKKPEPPLTLVQLAEVKERSDSELVLFIYNKDEKIFGVAQISYMCTPPKYQAYVNAVVIDKNARGKGTGTILMNQLIASAKKRWPKVRKVMLTSGPRRGARTFYERLGFVPRVPENDNETIVYVKDIGDYSS